MQCQRPMLRHSAIALARLVLALLPSSMSCHSDIVMPHWFFKMWYCSMCLSSCRSVV